MMSGAIALLVILLGYKAGLSGANDSGADDAGRMIIGYRSIGRGERDLIERTGTLVRSRNTAAAHLGKGVYVSNSPYVFEREEDGTDSTVKITANADAFKGVNKVWVPPEYWIEAAAQGHVSAEREVQITTEQLGDYIADHGLEAHRTLLFSKVKSAQDFVEQMLIPNDMIAHDQDGKPAVDTIGRELDIRATVAGRTLFSGIEFDWKEIKGIKEYSEETIQQRAKFLTDRAAEAADEASKQLKANAPESAEAIKTSVARTKRSVEGVAHLHRMKTNWVGYKHFRSAYKIYARARKTEMEFRKLSLARALEEQSNIVHEASKNMEAASDKDAKIAEAKNAVEKSRTLLETAEAHAASLKTAHEKVDTLVKVLNGGEDPKHIKVLAENPRAVWAKLQESFTVMGEEKLEGSLDDAIIDEAGIAKEEDSIFQTAVAEARNVFSAIEKAFEALVTPSQTPAKKEATDRPARDTDAKEKANKAADARAKAVDSANKLAGDSDSGSWLGGVLGGVATGIALMGGSAIAAASAAGGSVASGAATGTAAGAQVPALLSAQQSIAVTTAEVASVVAEVNPELGLQILLDSVPPPPTTPPVPQYAVIQGPVLEKRDASAKRAFQVAGPALERAFTDAFHLALKEARLHMGI
ncbi:hypothetical protein CDD81_3387 [Ophiocordyceps australis]|uniref:Enterotoxin n=1 Tax=Ophiocordyceps australis TaxID=1399860 RepID=A0A2C5XE51_9HYPO|nr:hypothetical protein CDD81_3387 [Ophiocordyceps australis]